MLRDKSNTELANGLRALRNQMRPLANELRRRGFVITEKHGKTTCHMTTFENIIISKPTTVKL